MARVLCIHFPATADPSSTITGLISGLDALRSRAGAIVQVAVVGAGREYAEKCAVHVDSTVYFVEHPALENYQPDRYLAASLAIARAFNPDVVLLPPGTRESEIAPRLAARLQAGVATDCVDLSASGDGFRFFRPVFGGKALAEVVVPTVPAVATMRGGVFTAMVTDAGKPGTVQAFAFAPSEEGVNSKPLGRVGSDSEGIRLEEAKVIVSGGRGMGGPEPFGEQLVALANVLGGAVGSSRPPVDIGWVPGGLQVGQTGKTVSPILYVAVAISGASQHIAGITGAKHVVAINSDAEAPIFGYSELGVVEDWKALLPPLIEALRQRLS